VNISDFGRSTGETFTGLLKELENVDGLERLRMGSVEPNLLTDEIIELTARSKVIMPHFHLPLQSGADQMLGLMKRRYNTALFASRIFRIRELLPGAFIGVDVIAGANGESRELFLESYHFIESLPVSQLHAFPYSERIGTKALEIPLRVPAELRKERTLKYISLSERKLRAFYESNRGKTEPVLFEEPVAGNRMTGFTRNYVRTVCACGIEMTGRVATVKLLSVLPDETMLGEMLK
jgi:threonylcarbamoyladenosine tRNA methylthiotransferase MtaB